MPDVVVVSGAPGTGKSTLARRLGGDLNRFVLAKDDIKEAIGDGLTVTDLAGSAAAGRAAMLVLYRLAHRLSRTGVPVVLDSTFDPRLAPDDLAPLWKHADGLLLHCRADPATVARRHHERVAAGTRHPVHRDGERTALVTDPHRWRAPEVPVPVILVDTTDGYRPGYPELLAAAR